MSDTVQKQHKTWEELDNPHKLNYWQFRARYYGYEGEKRFRDTHYYTRDLEQQFCPLCGYEMDFTSIADSCGQFTKLCWTPHPNKDFRNVQLHLPLFAAALVEKEEQTDPWTAVPEFDEKLLNDEQWYQAVYRKYMKLFRRRKNKLPEVEVDFDCRAHTESPGGFLCCIKYMWGLDIVHLVSHSGRKYKFQATDKFFRLDHEHW